MQHLNHTPFEDWLLTEDTLTQDETKTLHEHILTCETCQTLSLALKGVESEFRLAPFMEPQPGFVDRWQGRLAQARLRTYRRQTLWIMLASIGGAMLLFTLLVVLVVPLLASPRPVLWAMAYEMTSTVSFVSTLGGALLTVLKTIFNIVPATQWAAIWIALTCLAAVWIVAMHRLTIPRRVLV